MKRFLKSGSLALAAALAFAVLLTLQTPGFSQQLTLVSQTPADGTTVNPGSTFTASWTFRNNSTTVGVPLKEAINYTTTPRFAEANLWPVGFTLAPRRTYTVSIPMRAPEIAGNYTETWRLFMQSGAYSPFSLRISVPPRSVPALQPNNYVEGKFLYPLGDRRFNIAPTIVSRFGDWVVGGSRKGHLADDLPCSYEPVYAIGKGMVAYTGNWGTDWGLVCITAHKDPRAVNQSRPIYSLYAHLSEINVQKDTPVDWRTKLGKSGSAGTGPHVHWSIFYNPNVLTMSRPGYTGTIFNDNFITYSSTKWEAPSKFVRENLVGK